MGTANKSKPPIFDEIQKLRSHEWRLVAIIALGVVAFVGIPLASLFWLSRRPPTTIELASPPVVEEAPESVNHESIVLAAIAAKDVREKTIALWPYILSQHRERLVEPDFSPPLGFDFRLAEDPFEWSTIEASRIKPNDGSDTLEINLWFVIFRMRCPSLREEIDDVEKLKSGSSTFAEWQVIDKSDNSAQRIEFKFRLLPIANDPKR